MTAPTAAFPSGTPVATPNYMVQVAAGGPATTAFPSGTPIADPIYLVDSNGNPYQFSQTVFAVADYGAVSGNNNTNKVLNTTAVNDAMAAAVAAGGGIVFLGPGYLVTKNVDFSTANGVTFLGCGPGATVWKLADGENTDLLSAYTANINLNGTNPNGPTTAVTNFSFRNMTLDGNYTNQSSGTSYVMRFYGYGFTMDNVHIQHGYSGGVLHDYYGTFPTDHSYEAIWSNFKIIDNQGIQMEVGGPTDSIWSNAEIFTNLAGGSHDIHICQNAGGLQASNIHAWFGLHIYGRVPWLIEGVCSCVNCEAEGGDTVQLVMAKAQASWRGGRVFAGSHNGAGIQIGQVATATLATGVVASPFTLTTVPNTVGQSCYLEHVITGAAASGSIAIVGTDYAGNAASETLACSGNGTFRSVNAYASVTSETVTGLAGFSIIVNGLPLPYTGQTLQSGGVTTAVALTDYVIDTLITDIIHTNGSLWFVNDAQGSIIAQIKQTSNTYYTGSFNRATTIQLNNRGIAAVSNDNIAPGLFQLPGKSLHTLMITDQGNIIFDVNTSNKRAELLQNAPLWFYSDNFTTLKLRLENGTVCYYPSTSAAATATSGTITTSGVGIARVAPTGAVTAVVLQAGTIAGQRVTVINEAIAANTVTFAASGTSNVADGTGDVIAGLKAAAYVWNSSTSLWYRCN